MKIVRADIGHSPELHKMYIEYAQDAAKKRVPTTDYWFYAFRDPTFFCLFMKHGKRNVGMVMGRILPFYDEPIAHVDMFFVRRGFKSIKFIRGLYIAAKRHLMENDVREALYLCRAVNVREKKIVRGVA